MNVETGVRAQRVRAGSGETGFSLIETLIAALLLLLIVIGILPLFSRAMMNNIQGNDSSNIANAAVNGFEQLFPLPFANQALTIPAGSTEVVNQQFYSLALNRWMATIPSGDEAQYGRTVRIQQFAFSDLADDGTLDVPLDGGADPANVQFKVLDLTITNTRMLEFTPPYRLRALQAF